MRRRAQLAAIGLALALVVGLVAAPAGAQWVNQYLGRTFTSTAPSGVNGFQLRVAGARLDLGPAADDAMWSAGTVPTTSLAWAVGPSYFGNGMARWSVGIGLPTCNAAAEGYIGRQTGTGGTSTGARTRFCLCQSDGAASPTYAWQNIVSGTVGGVTTCNP